jgi:hypothetical protein
MDPGYSFLASLKREFRDDEAERLRSIGWDCEAKMHGFNQFREHELAKATLHPSRQTPSTASSRKRDERSEATLSGIHSVTVRQRAGDAED